MVKRYRKMSKKANGKIREILKLIAALGHKNLDRKEVAA
jgi:hypothetical protein